MTEQKQDPTTAETTLDIAGQYPLRVVKGPDGKPQLELDLTRANRAYFRDHLQELLQLEVGGTIIKPLEKKKEAIDGRKLHFTLPADIKEGAAMMLRTSYAVGDKVFSQPVSSFVYQGETLAAGPKHTEYQMSISETRALGRNLRRDADLSRDVLHKIPYDRKAREGFDASKHAPITDVHTHASAQVSGVSLVKAAIDEDLKEPAAKAKINGVEKSFKGICYPVELLKQLGVYDPNQPTEPMLSREFNPGKDDGLACEQKDVQCDGVRAKNLTEVQRDAIIAKMDIAADTTMSFSDFDRKMYRFRNPFVKHPALTKPILRSIAADYEVHGIKYAELSTGSMMDPAWFKEMAEVVKEIEDAGGPKLRFLIGIPRNASPSQTFITLTKIKQLARHPYIVGADLLGYESNKTSEFGWALAHLAAWARASEGSELKPDEGWDFKRDFIIRVHAGETAKNQDNVRHAINIAAEYGVRVRVGHGLHASLDEKSEKSLQAITQHMDEKGLSNPDQFATERCMDSNQVYRTKMLVHNQPKFLTVQARGKHGTPIDEKFVPRFLSSDGGGALQTNPMQLAYSSLAAGMKLSELADIRQFEQGYIDRQAQREALKTKAFESHYGSATKGLDAFLKEYQTKVDAIPREPRVGQTSEKNQLLDYLPPIFDGKKPILIGGASGSSWDKMDKFDRVHVVRAMEMLVRVCDPKKTYFVMGRVQNEGVSKALDIAVKHWNAKHPQEKFAVLGRFAGAGKDPTGDLADTVDWVQDIPEGRDYVPASMLNFITKEKGRFITKEKGRAIFFNGSDFTAEMAYGADDHGIPHALHEPYKSDGKMGEVAQTTETHSQFRDLDGFVEHVFKAAGDHHFFRKESDKKDVMRAGVDLEAVKAEVLKLKLSSEEVGSQGQSGGGGLPGKR